MIKKFLIVLTVLLFLAGCAQESYFEDSDISEEEDDILTQIQEIEKQLAQEKDEEIVEEINESVTLEEVINETAVEDNETAVEEVEEEIEEEVESTLEGLQKLEVEETDLVKLKLQTTDADGDAIEYTFSSPLNESGMWQTDYGDAGEYEVIIKASDGTSITTKKILLVVKKNNVAPTIEGLAGEIIADEGDLIKLDFSVNDLNGDEVEVSISEPLINGSWQTDHDSAGEYEATVTASDGEALTKETVKLIVNDVNVPPEITGIEDEINIKEGETLVLEPKVIDLDNDEVTVNISEPVGDDGVWEIGYDEHGEYEVVIRASDDKDTTEKIINLYVEDVNMPPEIINITLG